MSPLTIVPSVIIALVIVEFGIYPADILPDKSVKLRDYKDISPLKNFVESVIVI